MKTLYFDCFSGISGDMNLGALVDVGVPEEYLIEELKTLHIDDEFSLKFEVTQKMGITGTRAHVHVHEHHEHGHDHGEDHHHHHEHRNMHSISHIIEGSSITKRAKEWALKIFERIAVAEAKVHGTTVEKIHFHEVGATDSIVDIVGAAVCLDYLNVDKIMASKVEVGGGFVNCAHGTFPVPAPATTEILKGIPCTYGKVDSETTTPTGAAILAAMVDEFLATPELVIEKIGYGLGYKDFKIPNVLRVMLGESVESQSRDYDVEDNLLIETNIDDMKSEDYEILMERLLSAGALDVFVTPIIMKKSRPANKLSILLTLDKKDELLSILFRNSTSFGVRITKAEKNMLKREMSIVETSFGPVKIKKAIINGKIEKWKLEYDVVKTIAETQSISVNNLRNKLTAEIESKL